MKDEECGDKVFNWLEKIDSPVSDSPVTIATPNSKLIDTTQHHPPSPPESRKRPSDMENDLAPTPKRKRLVLSIDGLETPRTSRNQGGGEGFQTASPVPSLSSRAESQSEHSQASGRSSPSKRMAAMELASDGIETRVLSLTNPNLPLGLSHLLVELENCSNGVGVISSDLKAEINDKAKEDPGFHTFLDFMFASPATRDQLGLTPSLDDVVYLVEEAAECQATMQSESGWNMMVHHPMLHKALYGQRRRSQLIGFAPCTTAKIIREYLPTRSPPKMVDFCVYVVPEMEEAASDAIKRARRALPCNVINHTDFLPFRNRPIAVTIETKRRGGGQLADAELQLGTWHAAQWKLLELLVTEAGGTFAGLPFLPAVIVHGHDWSFAATTREGQSTVLWLEKGFGSTNSPLGVYKTVWGLQRLARWATEVYWPWFRKNALKISEGWR